VRVEEVVAVIAAMNAVDHRVEPVLRNDDPRIGLFHKVLGPYPYRQAEEAIVEYASESHNVVMQVGNVVEGIKRIRGRNLDRVSRAELIPPDELEPGQYPEWVQLARQAIADGAPDARAAAQWADESLDVSRREIGPSVGPLSVSQIRGQARMDVVAGELLVTEDREGTA
jgi:hypothetical protein